MMFFFKLPQTRHPERSASQIDCVIQRLWRVVEGPRRCLFCPCCSEHVDHRSPTTGCATPLIRLERELKPGANALLPSSPIPKGGKQCGKKTWRWRRNTRASGSWLVNYCSPTKGSASN